MIRPEMRRPVWDRKGASSTDEKAPINVNTDANPPKNKSMGSSGFASSLLSPPAMNER